jgi:fluoride exporter
MLHQEPTVFAGFRARVTENTPTGTKLRARPTPRRTGEHARNTSGHERNTSEEWRSSMDDGTDPAARGRSEPRWLGGRVRPAVVAAIALGGALGSPARYALGLALPVRPGAFPWATFWTNLSGSFLLGLLLTLIIERWPPTRFVRPFAAVGFIGSYTTWSTFVVEVDRLAAHGHAATAAVYAAASLIAGLAAVAVGVVVGRLLPAVESRLG